MLSLSRVASAAWTAAGWNGSGGRIALCRSCARTLRRSLTVQVSQGQVIELEEEMTVADLAKKLRTNPIKIAKMIQNVDTSFHEIGRKQLMEMNFPFTLWERVVKRAGLTPRLASHALISQHRNPANMVSRPPVVTVMGHVDHGKTTLLDSLRQTSVAAQEVGGITQHIGAFSVKLSSGHLITFLDTPGHAAFSNMRARGAGVTDIVVLVVAADDGVMQQTLECIQLVQQAKVPMVVAINKCDKYGVDIDKIKRELLKYNVHLEEFGGDVQAVEISALKGEGLDSLEEAILAQAELCEIRGDPSGPVEGTVIESKVDKGLGPIATVIVQHGTLTKGGILVAGQMWGKIRTMLNEQKKTVKSAPPSTPVVTVGWKELPSAGDRCLEADSEQHAREVCARRAGAVESRRRQLVATVPVEELETGERDVEAGGDATVPLIVKGDVAGSVEAMVDVIKSRHPNKFHLKVIQSGVGAISESDIEMAAAFKAVILGFNVSANKQMTTLAQSKGVSLLSHNIIYKLLDLLKDELASRLTLEWEEEILGEALVTKVFKLTGSKKAAVGGCRVKQGKLTRQAIYRIIRDDKIIHQGHVTGMKREKEDIEVARKDTECGISFSKDPGFQEGDRIVCLNRKRVLPTLKWELGF